jgi:nucleotide-binding universal stress UspA family protein
MAETTIERAVFAGVDTSQPSLGAARWAAQEAVRQRLPLRLVHAGVFDTGIAASAEDEASLERWYRSIDGAGRAARTTAAEATAELVVLGSHGLGGLRGILVGSLALKVAFRASCPVVVVRGQAPDRGGPVVIGVDAVTEDGQAVEFALAAAVARHVPLVVAHAWDSVPYSRIREAEPGERLALEHRMAGWQLRYPAIDVRMCALRDRDAARTLLRLSAEAQLVVAGSAKQVSAPSGMFGPTGTALLQWATCPVAVVPERKAIVSEMTPRSRVAC